MPIPWPAPEATAAFVAGLDERPGKDGEPSRFFLGPVTGLDPDPQGARMLDFVGDPWEVPPGEEVTAAVVVIDAGIAFWNSRFNGRNGSRFHDLRFLDFDLGVDGLSVKVRLAGDSLAESCATARQQGVAAVIDRLGTGFPNSFYDPRWQRLGRGAGQSGPDPDALWHGTAIADLAAGADDGSADKIALFGIELPMQVVSDADGDSLTAVLAVALHCALQMTQAITVPVVIVLPYGFTGGPQDGGHPAAQSIRKVMAMQSDRDVTLLVPAGNHLQDRCRAQLPPSGTGADARQPGLADRARRLFHQ